MVCFAISLDCGSMFKSVTNSLVTISSFVEGKGNPSNSISVITEMIAMLLFKAQPTKSKPSIVSVWFKK
jgi:hypothetical protein